MDTSRRGSPALYSTLFTAVGDTVLSTVALVLWSHIEQAAIERADNAGCDETLLLLTAGEALECHLTCCVTGEGVGLP